MTIMLVLEEVIDQIGGIPLVSIHGYQTLGFNVLKA